MSGGFGFPPSGSGGAKLFGNTFRVAVDSNIIDITGLNPSLDGGYCIWGKILVPASVPELDVTLQPGGATANQATRFMIDNGAPASTTDLRIAQSTNVGAETYYFRAWLLNVKPSADARLFSAEARRDDGVLYKSLGRYTDTTDFNHIQIAIMSGGVLQTTKILTGSYVKCQALGWVD